MNCESKLAGLPPAEREQLDTWLFSENRGYVWITGEIKRLFRVSTSIGSISKYRKRRIVEIQVNRITEARQVADAIEGSLSDNGNRMSDTVKRLVPQLAFELATETQPDVKRLCQLINAMLKAESLGLDDRRLTLLEAQAKQAQQTEEIVKSNLSPEEQAQRLREVFKVGTP